MRKKSAIPAVKPKEATPVILASFEYFARQAVLLVHRWAFEVAAIKKTTISERDIQHGSGQNSP